MKSISLHQILSDVAIINRWETTLNSVHALVY